MNGEWGALLNGVYLSGGNSVQFQDVQDTPGCSGLSADEILGCLTVPPDGLDLPDQRTEDIQFPQRDGTKHFRDWYESRIVTLVGVVEGDGCPNCPSAAEKKQKILKAWRRQCDDVELVIYTDCHGTEPPTGGTGPITGPFGIIGRPRVAKAPWRPGRKKIADLTLRFDAVDHKMFILDKCGTPGSGAQCVVLTPSIEGNCRHYTGAIPGLDLDGVAGSHASTPDAAALDIVGDIDIRVRVAPDDWTPGADAALLSKSSSSGTTGYELRLLTTGALLLLWGDGAAALTATSSVLSGVTNGQEMWVRATLDVNNGAAGRDIKFYTSTDGVTWAQVGSTVTQAGVTSIAVNANELRIGARVNDTHQLAGVVGYAEVRNSIGGTVVADPDFAAQTHGATSFSDGSNTWMINGAAVLAGPEYCYPKCYDVVSDNPGNEETADNVGTLCACPEILLTGQLTDARIENVTTGDVITFDGVITRTSPPVIIDTENGTATQDGITRTFRLSGDLPFCLAEGDNLLRLISFGSDDDGNAEICWRAAVESA